MANKVLELGEFDWITSSCNEMEHLISNFHFLNAKS